MSRAIELGRAGGAWLASRPRVRAALALTTTAALALFAFAWDSAVLTADLRKPLAPFYGGDGASFAAMHFKGLLEGGYYVNPSLGAPLGMDLRDFPSPDVFYLGTIWLLVRVTHNWALAWNLFYILGYPAAALTAHVVMRRYGLRHLAVIPGAVLFAFLPYHAARAFGHPHLGLTYFLAAMATILPLDVLLGERCGLEPRVATSGFMRLVPRIRLEKKDVCLYLVALAVGLWGSVYYWFFALVVLLVAGVASAAARRESLPFVRAVALAGVSFVSFVAQTAPIILHQRAHGRVPAGLRSPGDAELFGLKIVQLVLPMAGHRLDALRRFRRVYDLRAPLVNENGTAYIGLVGAVGLAVLLIALLRGRSHEDGDRRASRLLWPLSIASFAAVLLGTVGGLGSLVAFFGFPDVRSYNRISIFVGFYALFAISVVLHLALEKRSRTKQLGVAALGAAVMAFGIYDTTLAGTPDYAFFARGFDAQAAFVADVEAKLPEGAMVLELPYLRFPEGGRVNQLEDYAPIVPYLYSRKLRWTYGAMRDRRGDAVYEALARLPVEEMLDAAIASGFDAIYVLRPGFEDGGKRLEEQLGARVGAMMTERSDKLAAVYSLVEWGKTRRAELGAARVASLRHATLESAYLGFRDGFEPMETTPGTWWRWGQGKAKLVLENPTSKAMRVELSTQYRTAEPEPQGRRLVLDGVVHVDTPILGHNQKLALVIDLPPGEHVVTVRCDAVKRDDPNDWREPVFLFQDYVLRELP